MNENSNEENQLKDVTDILRRSIKSRVENDDDFYDKVLRKSQSDRASIITDILRNYKDQQKERFNFKKDKQKKLLYVLLGIIGCLTITIIVLSIYLFQNNISNSYERYCSLYFQYCDLFNCFNFCAFDYSEIRFSGRRGKEFQ